MSGEGSGGWTKSPPELVARFDAAVARHPGVDRRQMFGCAAGFVAGHLATSLFEDTWAVRLPEADRTELLALDGARAFEPMRGRPMREYVVFPQAIVDDDAALDGWLSRAVAYTASLPPKEKAKPKSAR